MERSRLATDNSNVSDKRSLSKQLSGSQNIPDQLPAAAYKADLAEKRQVSEHPSWSNEMSGNLSKSLDESKERPEEENFPQVRVTYADDLRKDPTDRDDRKSNVERDGLHAGKELGVKPTRKAGQDRRRENTFEPETSDFSGEFVPKFPGILSRGEPWLN